MKNRYSQYVNKLAETVLTGNGMTNTVLRQKIALLSAAYSGQTDMLSEPLPSALEKFVEKVALNAYKITDDDIRGLKNEGFSEDAIFEITVCIALGAGLSRLNRALSVLKGGN